MSDILTNDWGYCHGCGVTLHTCGELGCEDDDEMFIMTGSELPYCQPCHEKLNKKGTKSR